MAYSVTFHSPFPNLRVSFPPEQFNMGVDVEGKPAPYKPVKFVNGRIDITSEKVVEMMREHRGNEQNGGDSFFEVQPDVQDALNQITRGFEPSAIKPEGELPKDIAETLKYLTAKSDRFSGNEVSEIHEAINKVIDCFQVIGVQKPKESLKGPRLKARIIELLGILEDSEIYPAK